jgi:hypothetical protein
LTALEFGVGELGESGEIGELETWRIGDLGFGDLQIS